jgi:hypothetical protein
VSWALHQGRKATPDDDKRGFAGLKNSEDGDNPDLKALAGTPCPSCRNT